jgi:hypothetical protein
VRATEDACYVEQEIGGAPSGYTLGPERQPPRLRDDLVIHTPEALFTEERPPDWTTRVWVIPRRKLAPLLPGGTGATLHIPHRHGTVALAAAHMESLTRQADRLEPAAEAVVDNFCRLLAIAAGVGRSVANVEFGWGFEDLRTFGRAFQRVYGLSTGEALAMARAGTPRLAG